MTSPGRALAIFRVVCDLEEADLAAALNRECGGDDELREAVRRLLELDRDEGGALGDTGVGRAQGAVGLALGELDTEGGSSLWLPERIGSYRVVARIGSGGMGVVYEAEQPEPRRRVALKVVHPLFASTERIRRLRREAEVLGRLHHPHIAQIFEAGSTDLGHGPQPFLAMELVDGVDLLTHAERSKLSIHARLRLLSKVADAAQHAHERGVIHRDLKPDNILVTAEGSPKVLDFGIARLSDTGDLGTFMTGEGQVLGTLAYMAPEQLSGHAGSATVLADVHALGVLAYELLSGRLPLDLAGCSLPEAAELVRRKLPIRLGQLDRRLNGDVEVIVQRALEKEPERRYASAADFAADLRRHVSNEPILARPPSKAYRTKKFVARHRGIVAGVAATLLTFAVGAAVALGFALQASQRADELQAEREMSREALYRAEMLVASELSSRPSARRQLSQVVERWVPEAGQRDFRGWEWGFFKNAARERGELLRQDRPLLNLDWSPGGEFLAASGGHGIEVIHMATRETVLTPSAPGRWHSVVAWSPNGERLAHSSREEVMVLDVDTWEPVWSRRTPGPVGLGWGRVGNQLLVVDRDGQAVVHDLRSGAESVLEREWRLQPNGVALSPFPGPSSEDRGIALFHYGELRTLEAEGWSELRNKQLVRTEIRNGMAWSPDAEEIVVVSHSGDLIVVDSKSLGVLRRTEFDVGGGAVAWSPDGSLLATGGTDYAVKLWDSESLRERNAYSGHAAKIEDLAWSPDGRLLVSAAADGKLLVWDVHAPTATWSRQHTSVVSRSTHGELLWSNDGERVAAILGGATNVWSRTGAFTGRYPGRVVRSAGSAGEGMEFVEYGLVLEGDTSADHLPRSVLGALPTVETPHPERPQVAFRQGTEIWVADFEESSTRRFATGLQNIKGIAWSRDGSLIVAVGEQSVRFLNASTGERVSEFALEVGAKTIQLACDGQRAAIGCEDHRVRVVGLNGDESVILDGHQLPVSDIAWVSNDSRIATASADQTVKLWDPVTGALCASFLLDAPVVAVSCSPDGVDLAALTSSGRVQVWSAGTKL